MIYIKNDYEKEVISVGAPGSLAHVKVQYPKLIDRVSYLHLHAFSYHANYDDEIIAAMIEAGVEGKMEAESIIQAVMEKLILDFPGDKMERIPALFIEAKGRAIKETEDLGYGKCPDCDWFGSEEGCNVKRDSKECLLNKKDSNGNPG